jgi:hypothetical protein
MALPSALYEELDGAAECVLVDKANTAKFGRRLVAEGAYNPRDHVSANGKVILFLMIGA